MSCLQLLRWYCGGHAEHDSNAAQEGPAQPSGTATPVARSTMPSAGMEQRQQQQQQPLPPLPPPKQQQQQQPSTPTAAQPAPQQRLRPNAAAACHQPPPASLRDMLRVSGSLAQPSAAAAADAAWWLDDSTLQYVVKLHRFDQPLVLTVDAEPVTLSFEQVKLMRAECKAV